MKRLLMVLGLRSPVADKPRGRDSAIDCADPARVLLNERGTHRLGSVHTGTPRQSAPAGPLEPLMLECAALELPTRVGIGSWRVAAGRAEEVMVSEIHYKIVEHDGGWAYALGDVFSETYRNHDDALIAARRVARAQEIPGANRAI